MKKIFLSFLMIFPTIIYSQDVIILRNGEQIEGKITKVDSINVYYDFQKGERKLSSFVEKKDIRSYQTNSEEEFKKDSVPDLNEKKEVIVNQKVLVKETNKWNNMVTYSQKFGIHAKGWSVQYYGYNQKNTSRWAIPILFGIEGLNIDPEYFSQSDYQSLSMNYGSIGISPFYYLNEIFLVNLGVNVIYGEELLTDYYGEEKNYPFYGFTPSQGISYVSKSKVGLTVGISIYEKLLTSKVYKNDLGVKLEIGIKF